MTKRMTTDYILNQPQSTVLVRFFNIFYLIFQLDDEPARRSCAGARIERGTAKRTR